MILEGAKTTAAAVANEFLDLWKADDAPVPPIDQMKLQKLLFYAQAWHLANDKGLLFEEDFQAWPWGPIVPDIYSQTRKYGRSPVSDKLYTLCINGLKVKFEKPEIQDPELKEFLKRIWDTYKEYTGIQLSNLTHSAGEPWTIVKEQYGDNLDSKPKIPNELIKSVFKGKLTQ